jgi:hypothetical protein
MVRSRSVTSVRSPTELMPWARWARSPPLREMSVPGAVGLNEFLILMGIAFATAGAIEEECSTFAPKCDSSEASS